MTFHVVPLREQPHHLETVAGWIYRQWWSETATPVAAIEHWLRTHLGETGFPATFIAVRDDEVLGSATLHETEAADRPAYRPYLGALFVMSDARRHGLGRALVRAVEARTSELGHAALYLNAADAMTGFYEELGWEIVERGYGPKRLNIMRRLRFVASRN